MTNYMTAVAAELAAVRERIRQAPDSEAKQIARDDLRRFFSDRHSSAHIIRAFGCAIYGDNDTLYVPIGTAPRTYYLEGSGERRLLTEDDWKWIERAAHQKDEELALFYSALMARREEIEVEEAEADDWPENRASPYIAML